MTTESIRSIGVARPRFGRTAETAGPRIVPLAFYTVLVVALFFAMIYLRIALDRTAFELDELERAIELEETRTLDLRLEIAQLQDPIRIATEAERIGLAHPSERFALVVTGSRDTAPPAVEETPISAHQGRTP
jgi:cell division protein FtsL